MRALGKLITALVAVTVALTTLTVVAAPTATAAAADTYERQAHQATNKHRAKHDLVKLRRHACLQRYADRQARRMSRQERMYHQDLGPVLQRCRMRMVGENVAVGYPSGRAVVNQGWMRSTGHRANILRKQFRLEAVGARRGSDGRWYVAQVFGRR